MKSRKSKSRKAGCGASDVECPREASQIDCASLGVIMPHVVSPNAAGGDVAVPRIVPKEATANLERILAREKREAAGDL